MTVPVFPGGYTIGGLLLLNLVAAHVYRFKFEWKKSGILLTHLGLIVLLVGELLTGLDLGLASGVVSEYVVLPVTPITPGTPMSVVAPADRAPAETPTVAAGPEELL